MPSLPLLLLIATPALAGLPPAGAYEVVARLQLPNILGWVAQKTTMVCLPPTDASALPLPVLSDNNPFGACWATSVRQDGAELSFDIACPGRGAARAHAAYRLAPAAFEGRIDMVMGGKNMTMTEFQSGRRTGDCSEGGIP